MGLETVHRPSRTKIGDIEIDVVLTESSTDSAETTDHPVEQGFDVSDHARLKPVTLQITGIISNTPVGAVQSQRVVSLGGGVTFTSVSAERVGGAVGFAERAAADLRKLLEARQLVTVTTSKRVYTDMMLTELVTPLKPLEAMAQGRLVAASSVGGHKELIQDGVTGTLFAPDDPAAIADALAGLFGNRAGWDARRGAAKAFVERERSWAVNVARYEPVYHILLQQGAGKASANR